MADRRHTTSTRPRRTFHLRGTASAARRRDGEGLEDAMLLAWMTVARASDVMSEQTHAELVVGFLGGERSLGAAPFELSGDDRPLAGLDAPFAAYPLQDALVVGPRLEARVVAPPLRASLGWQRPYPDWGQPIPFSTEPDGDGASVGDSLRGLHTDEILGGIGAEAPTGLVVPWAEVLGVVHLSRAELEVDGREATYRSDSFSLGVRAGLRWQVSHHTFVEAAGDVLPLGPLSWGASVGLGVAAF